jgi:hypothetical protein
MKDLRTALTERVTEIEEFLAKSHVAHADAETFLKENTARIEGADRDLTETRTHLALLTGTPANLLPANVVATEGIGLQIGALLLAPPTGAGPAELRRYAGVMRALYDHATHQAVLATGAADQLEPDVARMRGQALQITASLPAYKPPTDLETGICLCRNEVYRREPSAPWLHTATDTDVCFPLSSDPAVFAQRSTPIESGCTDTPEVCQNAWCPVHRPAVAGDTAVRPDQEHADA